MKPLKLASIKHAKDVARELRNVSKRLEDPRPLSECQALVARMLGHRDWHDLETTCASNGKPSKTLESCYRDCDVEEVLARERATISVLRETFDLTEHGASFLFHRLAPTAVIRPTSSLPTAIDLETREPIERLFPLPTDEMGVIDETRLVSGQDSVASILVEIEAGQQDGRIPVLVKNRHHEPWLEYFSFGLSCGLDLRDELEDWNEYLGDESVEPIFVLDSETGSIQGHVFLQRSLELVDRDTILADRDLYEDAPELVEEGVSLDRFVRPGSKVAYLVYDLLSLAVLDGHSNFLAPGLGIRIGSLMAMDALSVGLARRSYVSVVKPELSVKDITSRRQSHRRWLPYDHVDGALRASGNKVRSLAPLHRTRLLLNGRLHRHRDCGLS